MNNDNESKLFITNTIKNSKISKENGKKITFNVPNGLSDNTFEYDLYLHKNNNEDFFIHNVDGVKLIYWDDDLFDTMTPKEIDNYLNTKVLWVPGDPINICYDKTRTDDIENKMNIKYASKVTTTISKKRKNNSGDNNKELIIKKK